MCTKMLFKARTEGVFVICNVGDSEVVWKYPNGPVFIIREGNRLFLTVGSERALLDAGISEVTLNKHAAFPDSRAVILIGCSIKIIGDCWSTEISVS